MAYSALVSAALKFLDASDVVLAEKLKAQLEVAITGTDWIQRTQVIGDSEESLDKGEIGTIGYCFFRHTGYKTDGTTAVTDTISLRLGTGVADFITLKAGDIAVCPLHSSTTPYAIASDVNAPVLEYMMIEE